MFSSNVGFRRRTVSEGYNQLYPPSSNKRTSSTSYRYSLDESSSIPIKRVVLRKHSSESGSRLADRLARSEVENINGFWSRRLSGRKRSVPSSSKQDEPNVAEWSREVQGRVTTSSNIAERGQAALKPRGPRPLSKPPMTSPRTSAYLNPFDALGQSSQISPSKSTSPFLLVPVDQERRKDVAAPSQTHSRTPHSLTKAKGNNTKSVTDHPRDTSLVYRPLLPPGLPVSQKPSIKPTMKSTAEKKDVVKEKEKKRFAHLELTLTKLVSGNFGSKKAASNGKHSTQLTVYSEKPHISLIPPSLPMFPTFSIPIPPIPTSETPPLPSIYKTHAGQVSRQSIKSTKSTKSSKSKKSARRKSSRKRKTGLARIVVELARGEKVVALDAEAIQEAAEVREILAQLRQMKASR